MFWRDVRTTDSVSSALHSILFLEKFLILLTWLSKVKIVIAICQLTRLIKLTQSTSVTKSNSTRLVLFLKEIRKYKILSDAINLDWRERVISKDVPTFFSHGLRSEKLFQGHALHRVIDKDFPSSAQRRWLRHSRRKVDKFFLTFVNFYLLSFHLIKPPSRPNCLENEAGLSGKFSIFFQRIRLCSKWLNNFSIGF